MLNLTAKSIEGGGLSFSTEEDAARYLRQNLEADTGVPALRELLSNRFENLDVSRLSDDEVRAQVSFALYSGTISVAQARAPVSGGSTVAPSPKEEPVPVGPAPNQPPKSLTVSLSPEKCRCGDKIKLKSSAQNIPDGTAVKYELTQDSAVVATVSSKLGAGEVEWISKAATDKRPEPKFELVGSSSGVTATGAQKLELQKYNAVAAETKTINCASGVFGWTGKFDIELKNGQLVVTVKIKLVNRLGAKPANANDPLPAIGDPVTAQDKTAMKTDVEGKLSHKRIFHRVKCARGDTCDCSKTRSCCYVRCKIVVDFVESGEHHTVNLFQGPGRANATNWTRVKTRDNSWAHETGHLLGWYDEYAGGAVGTAPRWKVQTPVVMNTGLRVPAEYYWDFRDWLKAKTGEDWKVLRP